MEQQLNSRIVLVFGRICSGKGSYEQSHTRIVVSDIVKRLINSTDRDKLQDTTHLDTLIAEQILIELQEAIKTKWDTVYIIDGIRQVSIVEKILHIRPNVEMVWLEVPVEERKRRYEARQDAKDVESFEVADSKPIELECQKIFDTFKERLTIINNY